MKAFETLAIQYIEKHPEQASHFLSGFSLDEISGYMAPLSSENLLKLLRGLPPLELAHCLKTLDQEKIATVFEIATPKEAASWLMYLDSATQERLLVLVSTPQCIRIDSFIHIEKNTAIFYIDATRLTLRPSDLVKDVFKKIKNSSEEVPSYLYITNDDQKLLGVIAARELMNTDQGKRMEEIMTAPVISLDSHASKQEIVCHPAWSDFHALPIVDQKNRFLGCLRYGKFKALEKEEQYNKESLFNISVLLFEAMTSVFIEFIDSLRFSKKKVNR
jgi:magnesium transporter